MFGGCYLGMWGMGELNVALEVLVVNELRKKVGDFGSDMGGGGGLRRV